MLIFTLLTHQTGSASQNLYEPDESSIDDHHLIEKVFMIAIKIISINKILILFL
jgi:hypothetical protein